MSRYLKLFAAGIVCLAVLIFFYVRSQSRFGADHDAVLEQLKMIHGQELELEKSVLLSRALISPNYDGIVKGAEALSQSCADLKGGGLIYGQHSRGVDALVDRLCDSITKNVERVEQFKSRHAVFENSVRYLRARDRLTHAHGRGSEELKSLLHAAYAYFYDPSSDAKKELEAELKKIGKGGDRFLLDHVRTILGVADDLKSLLAAIMGSAVQSDTLALQAAYAKSYEASLRESFRYQMGMLVLFALLFAYTAHNLLRFWRAVDAVAEAKDRLEERVKERTRELEDSLALIEKQRQSIAQASKLSALGEMAGGIAHEINTPLSVIALQSEILGEMAQTQALPADFTESIEAIRGTTQRIDKIIQGLRRFSRDGSHDPLTQCRVKDLIEDAVALCGERFKYSSVKLIVPKVAEDLVILCRGVEISQVLVNLLGNAFDAVKDAPGPWVEIAVKEVPGKVEISVTDSGNGIPEGVRANIFQPFFTTKPVGKGTGLGLSVSAGIISSHEDSLRYDENCANTRFSFALKKAA